MCLLTCKKTWLKRALCITKQIKSGVVEHCILEANLILSHFSNCGSTDSPGTQGLCVAHVHHEYRSGKVPTGPTVEPLSSLSFWVDWGLGARMTLGSATAKVEEECTCQTVL
jgi:hypothetical protein